jgi:hypothetical protein
MTERESYMDELRINCQGNDYRKPVIIYRFRWSNKGVAGGCLREQCVYKRDTDVFRGTHGYSRYDYYLVRDLTSLGAQKPIWCPFSPREVDSYLNDINRVLVEPIKWKIKETEVEGIPTLQIYLKVPNIYSWRQHLYILTRVRYLYEVPYCLYLRDAFRLQEIKNFSGGYEEAFLEVFKHLPSYIPTDLGSLAGLFRYPVDFGRIIPGSMHVRFISIEELQKRFIDLGNSELRLQLNDIFPEGPSPLHHFEPERLFDLRWWNDYYKTEREPVYLGGDLVKKYVRKKENSLLPGYMISRERLKKWETEIFE